MATRENSQRMRRAASNFVASEQDGEMEIDLLELLYCLLSHWKFIAIGTMVCVMLTAVWTWFVVTPKYEATAKLYVLNSNDMLGLADLQIGSYLTADYQEVFKTWEVHDEVIANLKLPYTQEEMEELLSITNPSGTRILYITALSHDPKEAQSIANEYAAVAKKYISTTLATDQPNTLSAALLPTDSVSPRKGLNLMLGFLVGALLTIGIITIRFITDDKIKTVDDIQRYTNIPTLAMVPALKNLPAKSEALKRRPA